MKLQVLQDKLSKGLSIASRFASQRAQLPVLGNILFTTKKNKLLLSSTNLEISVAISLGAQVEKDGQITIPSRTITDLVNNLPNEVVNLTGEKEKMFVKTENFESTVAGMNASDFPDIPQTAGKGSLNVSSEIFQKSLSQVLFAASVDETRPILTGVLFLFKKGSLTMVATDGFRLSQKKLSLKGITKSSKVINPKNALNELLRLVGDDEDVKFGVKKTDNQVVFVFDNITLSSRILEGEFPDFEKIIPKKSEIKINVDKQELLRAVKLASVFARDSANIVRLKVKKKSMDVSAESQQSGEQKTQLDVKVEGDTGKGFEIAFNYRFLEEFLGAIEGEDVELKFSDPSAPGVFLDPKDKEYLHLIMPVKTQG
jgi:DNA polymerase-3 subunit beta